MGGGKRERSEQKKDETDRENFVASDVNGHKEDKKREKDKDRKHQKQHRSAIDDANSDKDEKEESTKPRRHSSDHKKMRKVESHWCFCSLTRGKRFLGDISLAACTPPPPNQMVRPVKSGRKGTREITGMFPIEMVVMRSLRMGAR